MEPGEPDRDTVHANEIGDWTAGLCVVGEPTGHWLSTLPAGIRLRDLVRLAST
ncbi:hypothetical protein ACIRG5_00110 [Lentzea sp. NPDC102401]|uniref:hypothetical protein n=1 Tax=Lentzea sp. NPDC102401 TaxID=3364128 RepID=UPI0037FE879A